MALADILGTKDLIALVLVVSLASVLLIMGRRINLNVHGMSASIEKVKDTVGEKNGNGDVTTMLARALADTGELLQVQQQQTELGNRLIELSDYTHKGVHRLNGQVGMMWHEWAIQHGVNPDDLPPPQPSPSEEQL